MNKATVTIILTFVLSFAIAQQNTFIKTWGTNWMDFPHSVEVDNNGDIIVCGSSIKEWYKEEICFIIKLDSNGQLTNYKEIKDSFASVILSRIFITDSTYLFLGYKSNHYPPFEFHFYILTTDYDLNIINEVLTFYSDTFKISGGESIVDSDGNFVFSGLLRDSINIRESYVVKIDNKGQILHNKLGLYEGFCFGFNSVVIEDFGLNGYYMGCHQKSGGAGYRILHLDNSLNLMSDTIKMPLNMYLLSEIKKIPPNRLLIVSRGHTHGQVYLAYIDVYGNLLQYREYGTQGVYDMYGSNPIDVKGNSIFLANYPIESMYELYFPSINNKIFVQKMDAAFNVIWEKNIGWDAYFMQKAIKATADGGCLVVGSVYDSDTMYMRHDVVLFKIDIDGNITGINTINSETGVFKLFPNPGSNYFNIEVLNQEKWVKVFDLNGRLIKKEYLSDGLNRIDMQKASSGVYIIKTIDNLGKNIRSTRWIKN